MNQTHDELGYIDALTILRNPAGSDSKSIATANQHVKRYQFAAQFVAGKNILDVACGVGYGAELMNKAASYSGADIDAKAISEATRKYGESEKRKFCIADARTLPSVFKEGQFDTVVSFETVEHFREYDAFLEGVYKILKLGGELIISTPNRNITNAGKSLTDPTKWEHHTQEWTEPEFLVLLTKHGFKITKVYGQSFIMKPGIRNVLRGSGTLIKSLTQNVLPMQPLSLISESNYVLVRATK